MFRDNEPTTMVDGLVILEPRTDERARGAPSSSRIERSHRAQVLRARFRDAAFWSLARRRRITEPGEDRASSAIYREVVTFLRHLPFWLLCAVIVPPLWLLVRLHGWLRPNAPAVLGPDDQLDLDERLRDR